ncbi:hypothetical protein GGR57DRAFT_497324 [Xylariaceae sp. FL1272]|nr:hypothetical protein GGR57DRAFT_497324 [Xylariaceae sp. FL1272]
MSGIGPYQQCVEGGDEASFELYPDLYAESHSTIPMDTTNIGGQTIGPAVSAVDSGREVIPNHPQYSNKEDPGNEQMLIHPAANAYTQGLTSNLDYQQLSYPSYAASDLSNHNTSFVTQHGFPLTDHYSNIYGLPDPTSYTRGSVDTLNGSFSSSFGSSVTSERFTSMTLGSNVPQRSTQPFDAYGGHVSSGLGLEGHSWSPNSSATISPKMLRLNPSPTPPSSSESTQTSILHTSFDSDAGPTVWKHGSARDALPTKRPTQSPRKELPSKPSKPRRRLPSLGRSSSSNTKALLEPRRHRKSQSPADENILPPLKPTSGKGSAARAERAPEPVVPGIGDADRQTKNQFLVESKRKGLTYREIKRMGDFPEAESTLRGRYRTLTKNKEHRVRKPEWQEKDIRLLQRAVRKLAGDDSTSAKVPWKKVATYISEHGGSYHFGNATCRKKWDDLVKDSAEDLE